VDWKRNQALFELRVLAKPNKTSYYLQTRNWNSSCCFS